MALGASTFSDLVGAASDLFAGFSASSKADLQAQGLRIKAQGDLAEASNYDLAATLAQQNEKFTDAHEVFSDDDHVVGVDRGGLELE